MDGVFGKRVILAPMAGVSDMAMRAMSYQHGAELAFCEMVSAKGTTYNDKKTKHLVDLLPDERLVGVQLFGHEPEVVAAAAVQIEDMLQDRIFSIDINMGCPARKIISKGDGCALMNDAKLAGSIVSKVRSSVSHPVSVKFRRGFEEGNDTSVEFARSMEDAGASFLTVHGRYGRQMYRGFSDNSPIKQVKSSVSIPVIGNGDISDVESARKMLNETNCDAVMIARAARGNPWIFEQVSAMIDGIEIPEKPSVIERLETAKAHARLLWSLNPLAMSRMRKHAAWYVSGMKGASTARGEFNRCSDLSDFEEVFDRLIDIALMEDDLNAA